MRELSLESERRKWEPGQFIIRQGDVLTGLYVVISGAVSLSYSNADGLWYKRRVVDSNWLIGFLSVFDGLGQPHSYEAEEIVEGLIIKRESLTAVLERWPDLWFDVAAKMAANHRMVLKDLEESVLDSPKKRLVQILLQQARRDGAADPVLRVTQQELGSLVGITRQSVSHVLGALKARGLIEVRYGGVSLLDVEGLRSIAGIQRTL